MNRLAAIAMMLGLALAACRSMEPVEPVDFTYRTTDRTDLSMRETPAITAPPRLDPTRKVDEQDCSKPVALDRGNLRCR